MNKWMVEIAERIHWRTTINVTSGQDCPDGWKRDARRTDGCSGKSTFYMPPTTIAINGCFMCVVQAGDIYICVYIHIGRDGTCATHHNGALYANRLLCLLRIAN